MRESVAWASAEGRSAWRSPSTNRLLVIVITGVVTGGLVGAVDFLIRGRLFPWVVDRPVWLMALAPTTGLLLAALSLRWLAGGAMSATADEYVRAYHDPQAQLDIRELPGRLLAAIATVGLGAPLGVEGTAAYAGAAVGTEAGRRQADLFLGGHHRWLLVGGAAAGVGAIFRAPATGALFALDVLYQRDIGSGGLLPALVGSGTSYLAFSAIRGTDPILSGIDGVGFDRADLVGLVVLGLVCGLAARLSVAGIEFAKRLAREVPLDARLAVAAVVFAALVVVGDRLFGEPVVLGVGYHTIGWALDPEHGLGLIGLLVLFRAAGIFTAVAGGGVGGMFVPLVVIGALLGRLLGDGLGASNAMLFPVAGMAAFLGAGFRTPLAAVVFVAETTGGIGFIAPTFVAVVAAQLLMGGKSISPFQRVRQAAP